MSGLWISYIYNCCSEPNYTASASSACGYAETKQTKSNFLSKPNEWLVAVPVFSFSALLYSNTNRSANNIFVNNKYSSSRTLRFYPDSIRIWPFQLSSIDVKFKFANLSFLLPQSLPLDFYILLGAWRTKLKCRIHPKLEELDNVNEILEYFGIHLSDLSLVCWFLRINYGQCQAISVF